MKKINLCILLLTMLVFTSFAKDNIRIKLATTTSTENSGLLAYLLPYFEKDTGIKVDVIAVGTGKAMKLGENGDVDVVLAHARTLEDKFIADGFGVDRKDVMHNDFILLGAAGDPAGVKGEKDIASALKKIAERNAVFVSRGDNSGTHVKEREIWTVNGITPSGVWYKEAGQGMEEVINMADNLGGYTISDRGTYLSVKDKTKLVICSEGDPRLFNPYGIMAVNPAKWSHVKYKEASKFINWMVSKKTQKLIADFKINGEVLFYPDAVK